MDQEKEEKDLAITQLALGKNILNKGSRELQGGEL